MSGWCGSSHPVSGVAGHPDYLHGSHPFETLGRFISGETELLKMVESFRRVESRAVLRLLLVPGSDCQGRRYVSHKRLGSF